MKQTILYVEDDALQFERVDRMLRPWDFAVVGARSGEEALAYFRMGGVPELVLMDIDLNTELDGTETALRILELQAVPIVFASAHKERHFLERMETVAHFGFVAKPFHELVLLQAVKVALRLSKALSDREELARDLNRQSDRFRLITENITDGLLHSGSDFVIDYASGPYRAQLGHTSETDYHVNAAEVAAKIHPEDRKATMDAIFAAIEAKQASLRYVFRVMHAQGHYFYREDNARFFYNEDGTYRESYVICRDITLQKHAEAAMLEKERLNAISELASSVAHDFNNALQAISGNIEASLLTPGLPPSVARRLTIVRGLVQDGSQRIKPLHGWTDGPDTAMPRTGIDLDKLLAEVLDQASALWLTGAGKPGAAITVEHMPGAGQSVDGNRNLLRSAFFNLVKNAVEAMPQGGILRLETRLAGSQVGVRVSDTGIGMDEATRVRMFQPFFSTKGLQQGRGLGMSSVATIVSNHGGTLEVLETAPGKGSRLEVLLPLGTLAVEPSLVSLSVPSRSLRVLWVDDEQMIAQIGQELINLLGHQADCAFSGAEAIGLWTAQPYDVVITDLGMPAMNGRQLADALIALNPAARVVLLTGWNDSPGSDAGTLPFFAVLGKPATTDQISEVLQRVAVSIH